ncbi:hypothetical protein BDA96_01G316300 [Sorghum bicolor]|uniref:Uncharacterized protein n=1 Tax=Sorghum bicolor TaxID=4558 RepID=A0A921S1E7_SORBI|nr:hypothetical protein BDA96_01G316300 [Sorghum bicolor]
MRGGAAMRARASGKARQPPQHRGWFLSLLDWEKERHKLRRKTEQPDTEIVGFADSPPPFGFQLDQHRSLRTPMKLTQPIAHIFGAAGTGRMGKRRQRER